jgi:hypothetical protein
MNEWMLSRATNVPYLCVCVGVGVGGVGRRERTMCEEASGRAISVRVCKHVIPRWVESVSTSDHSHQPDRLEEARHYPVNQSVVQARLFGGGGGGGKGVPVGPP